MNEYACKRVFIDGLFDEVAFAVERAREIQCRFRKGKTNQDAEFIEQTLIGVAERLALQGDRAKEGFKRLLATYTGQGIGLHSDEWHILNRRYEC